jgi:hypothetical protein
VAEEKGWWEGEASPPEEAVPTPTQDSELGVRGRLGMLIIWWGFVLWLVVTFLEAIF